MRLTLMMFSKIGTFSTEYSNLPESYIKRAMKQVSVVNKFNSTLTHVIKVFSSNYVMQ